MSRKKITRDSAFYKDIVERYNKYGNGSSFDDYLENNWDIHFSDDYNQSLYDIYTGLYAGDPSNKPLSIVKTQTSPATQQPATQTGGLLGIIEEVDKSGVDIDEYSKASQIQTQQSTSAWMDIMKRLMEKEDKLGTGNPFIDAIESFTAFKRRKNPDYRFPGIVGGIGGLLSRSNSLPKMHGLSNNMLIPNGPEKIAPIPPMQEPKSPYQRISSPIKSQLSGGK